MGMVVVGGSFEKREAVRIRLDGILFHPFMGFNEVPLTCGGHCFPQSTPGKTTMGSSGCMKYYTPAVYDRSSQLDNCQCDMVKRLDCWMREGSKDLQCNQLKVMVRMHLLTTKRTATLEECGEVCARQLAVL